jgi:hypothetical protein
MKTVPIPPIVRIMRRVRIPTADGCWEWQGPKERDGYVRVGVGSRTDRTARRAYAHRITYEHYVGPIPDGLQLDHLCRNRSCCNPAHLEPVTPLENTRRGTLAAVNSSRQRAITHCQRGHPFSGENLYLTPKGRRICRACSNASARRRWRERKAS